MGEAVVAIGSLFPVSHTCARHQPSASPEMAPFTAVRLRAREDGVTRRSVSLGIDAVQGRTDPTCGAKTGSDRERQRRGQSVSQSVITVAE